MVAYAENSPTLGSTLTAAAFLDRAGCHAHAFAWAWHPALNSSIGDSNYLWYLDANNDGHIDQFDLGQFRTDNNASVF